jgi:cholesterol transport system auxiliary component
MRKPVNRHPIRTLAAVAAAALLTLAGCASRKGEPTTQFDFGPAGPGAVAQGQAAAALGPLVVADVTGSAALDNERILYRLSYADAQQARSYANSRWAASPLSLLTQRFKTRLGQAGAKTLSETDASSGIPILRIDVDEFVQDFANTAESSGRVAVRASLFRGHTLVDQRTFSHSSPANSADAAGGARALAASTDAIAADVASWLATQDLRTR